VQRSVGVTIISILSFLGSLFMLLMAGFIGIAAVTSFGAATVPASQAGLGTAQPPVAAMLIGAILVYVLPGFWGIASSIGMWKLRNWARISTIIFSVFLGLGGAGILVAAAVFPLPTVQQTAQTPDVTTFVRVFLGLMGFGSLAIALWWSIYLSRRTVLAQFTGMSAGTAIAATGVDSMGQPLAVNPAVSVGTQRPVSITVIAILLLFGAAVYPFTIWMHTPLMIFGFMLRGGASIACSCAFAILSLYLGVGLLKLWPQARVLAIAWSLFAIVNVSLSFFGRGATERFQQAVSQQRTLFGPAPAMVFPPAFMWMIGGFTISVALIQLYFLITRKAAFERAAI